MEPIVSTPDPGGCDHPQHNPREHACEPGEQISTLDWSRVVAEQTRILDHELAALLADRQTADQQVADEGIVDQQVLGDEATATALPDSALLPGFETLTTADLQTCPAWCIHADLPVHSDGFDPNPEQAPHRGVEHTIHSIHGGASIDHAGRAEITVQLEQDRDLATGPVVTLAITVQGIEHYTWLTPPETRALQHTLDHLLTDTDDQGRLG